MNQLQDSLRFRKGIFIYINNKYKKNSCPICFYSTFALSIQNRSIEIYKSISVHYFTQPTWMLIGRAFFQAPISEISPLPHFSN